MQHFIELLEKAGTILVTLFFILYIFKQEKRIQKLEEKVEKDWKRKVILHDEIGRK